MKLLAFDSESFPNVGLTWGTWEQRVIKVWHRRMVCSISWNWVGSKKVENMALPDFGGYHRDDRNNKKMMLAFKREVLAHTDVAIGHNLVEFDDKMVNTDMLLAHIGPPAPHRAIDTLKICRERFRLNSNKLDDVCEQLGIGRKLKHPGIEMWEGCMAGNAKMWSWMRRYNDHDVAPLLTGLYDHLRPWMRRHPNVSVDTQHLACPSCGHNVLKPDGYRHTQAMTYRKLLCLGCRSYCMGVTVRGKLVARTY